MATVATFDPFIISTDLKRADPKTRKLIRSHVMLGKNRGKRRSATRQRQVDQTGQASDASTPTSSDEDHHQITIPAKVGCEFTLIKVAAEVEPLLIQSVLKFTTQSKAQLFPLEPCIAFSHPKSAWVMPLSTDTLYCHAMMFAAQAALNLGSSTDRNNSPASHHFGQTVKLLRQRLERDDTQETTSDLTIMVIIVLATSALLTGQEEVARSHLAGVRRIVELRGGFASFGSAVKLLIEVLRCDIGLCLSTGQPPLFFHRPFSGPRKPQSSPRPPISGQQPKDSGFETLLPTLDSNLAYIWRSLRDFCKTINVASKTHRRLPEQMLLDSMASAIYPLLNMRFTSGSVSETCRLGLLAFCSNAFLQWQGMNVKYKSLPSIYRQSLLGLGQQKDAVPPQGMLWLLMMGGIALFTSEKDRLWLLPWLQETIDQCVVFGWEDVREALKPFLWVDFVHDRPGERLYTAAMEVEKR